MKAQGFQTSWAAGELGPDVWERSDLVQHAKGMAPGKNLLVLPQGPAMVRPGFWDRGATKQQTDAGRLRAFVRSREDALLLEFGDLHFRVWTPAGDPVLDGEDPLEVVTPWASAELDRLWFKQVGDVLYVTSQDGTGAWSIARASNTSWSIAAFDFRDGPWLPENADKAFTLEADGIKGTVALTASQDLFTSDHVGAQFRLRAQSSGAGMGSWTADYDVLIDYEMMLSDGKAYRTTTEADDNKTGTNPPVHEQGAESDGGMVWEYVHDGAGIARITAVTDATHATAEILTDFLPTQGNDATTGGTDGFRKVLHPDDEGSTLFPETRYWAEQGVSEARGWPRALVEMADERLAFAAPAYRPSMVWLSRSFGFGPAYGDFKPSVGTGRVESDHSVRLTVGQAGAPILWLKKAAFLIAGTSDGVFALSGGAIDDPITPTSYGAKPVSSYGVAPIEPLVIGSAAPVLLFLTRSGDTLLELKLNPDVSAEEDDHTILVDHLRPRRFAELAWQHPDQIVWARLGDGGLAAFTYHQKHQVKAWTTQELPGGFEVESIACVPGEDGADLLWALVRREKDDVMQRRLWRLATAAEGLWMDGAERYEGEAVSAVSGLPQFNGETVCILGRADPDAAYARQPDVAVAEGVATLKSACTDVLVGLEYAGEYVSLPLDLQGVGSTLNRNQRLLHADLTLSCVVARIGDGSAQGWNEIRRRPPQDLAAPLLKRITVRVDIGAGAGPGGTASGDDDRDKRVVLQRVGPWPMVVRQLRLEAEVQP